MVIKEVTGRNTDYRLVNLLDCSGLGLAFNSNNTSPAVFALRKGDRMACSELNPDDLPVTCAFMVNGQFILEVDDTGLESDIFIKKADNKKYMNNLVYNKNNQCLTLKTDLTGLEFASDGSIHPFKPFDIHIYNGIPMRARGAPVILSLACPVTGKRHIVCSDDGKTVHARPASLPLSIPGTKDESIFYMCEYEGAYRFASSMWPKRCLGLHSMTSDRPALVMVDFPGKDEVDTQANVMIELRKLE